MVTGCDCCAQEDGKVCCRLVESLVDRKIKALLEARCETLEKAREELQRSRRMNRVLLGVVLGLVVLVGVQHCGRDLRMGGPNVVEDLPIVLKDIEVEEPIAIFEDEIRSQELPKAGPLEPPRTDYDWDTNTFCKNIVPGGIRQILHDYPTEVIYLTKDREVWSCNKSTRQISKKPQEEFSDSPYLKTIFGGNQKDVPYLANGRVSYDGMSESQKVEFHFLKDRERNFRLYAEDDTYVAMPIIDQSTFGVFTWDQIKKDRYIDPVHTLSFKDEDIVSASLLDGHLAVASRTKIMLSWLTLLQETPFGLKHQNITAIQILPGNGLLVAEGKSGRLHLYSKYGAIVDTLTTFNDVTKMHLLPSSPQLPLAVLVQEASGVSYLIQIDVDAQQMALLDFGVFTKEVRYVKKSDVDNTYVVALDDWIGELKLN